jgi:hypothetical protein
LRTNWRKNLTDLSQPVIKQIRAGSVTSVQMKWLSKRVAEQAIDKSRDEKDAEKQLMKPVQIILVDKAGQVSWLAKGPCD